MRSFDSWRTAPKSHRRCALALLFLPLVLASACTTTHRPPGVGNDGLVTGRLTTVNPLDIVVPKLENLTGRGDLPLEPMRREFQAGLLVRRYSALALDYVDRSTVEAAYRPGTLGEQGVFQVFITGWDDSLWRSHARLLIDADVYMLDAADPEPDKALWGGHVTHRIELAAHRTATTNVDSLVPRAVAEFADRVLASLPPRDPERAAPAQ